MLSFKEDVKLYLGSEPVDMRKSINGLTILTAEALSLNPQSGHAFIFYNKRKDKLKLLVWDTQGFALYYKRLERGRFKVPRDSESTHCEIEAADLKWLLAGIDFMQLKEDPTLHFRYYA